MKKNNSRNSGTQRPQPQKAAMLLYGAVSKVPLFFMGACRPYELSAIARNRRGSDRALRWLWCPCWKDYFALRVHNFGDLCIIFPFHCGKICGICEKVQKVALDF